MLRGTAFTLAVVIALIGAQTSIAGGQLPPDLQKTPYCVARAQAADQPLVPVVAVCYATKSELVSRITGGALRSWNGDLRDPVQVQYINSVSQTDYLIGIDYAHTDYGDPTFTWTVTNPSGCAYGQWYQAPEYPVWWWNDSAASATIHLWCTQFIHYEDINYGGASYDCSPCPTMGSFNYKSSSVKFGP